MKKKFALWAAGALAAAGIGVGVIAWASSQNQAFTIADRAGFYDSLGALTQDSSQIIVGKVVESKVAHDEQLKMDVTLATIEVFKVSDSASEPSKTVVVRQTGVGAEGLKYLAVGKVYAIFAMLSDQTSNQVREYDIRGVDAGIYAAGDSVTSAEQALASDTKFERLDPSTPDILPATILLSDITAF
jgi:hypothetical protein